MLFFETSGNQLENLKLKRPPEFLPVAPFFGVLLFVLFCVCGRVCAKEVAKDASEDVCLVPGRETVLPVKTIPEKKIEVHKGGACKRSETVCKCVCCFDVCVCRVIVGCLLSRYNKIDFRQIYLGPFYRPPNVRCVVECIKRR